MPALAVQRKETHMAGSTFGKYFRVTTWGESHGQALGCVVDGVPAGLPLSAEDIQSLLNRRRPGRSAFTSKRREDDEIEILSGVFEGKTTGTPISLLVRNQDQHSGDYGDIAHAFRPGHADWGFFAKYGFRDYRGGGRSSGRETIGRVAAGAIAEKILAELGIFVCAYTKAIGPVVCQSFDAEEINKNMLYMPDHEAAERAGIYLADCMRSLDSSGGVVECRIKGVPAGVGEPVFDKLDASLARAICSIGAVKGFEVGDGFAVAQSRGSDNNDAFAMDGQRVIKKTNHAGGILGGFSDGDEIIFRAAVKPTPSIAQRQETVNEAGEEIDMEIVGRHDPVIVPRAVVVVESMAAITLVDLLFANMTARMDRIASFYRDK